jgi:hypothetical protein
VLFARSFVGEEAAEDTAIDKDLAELLAVIDPNVPSYAKPELVNMHNEQATLRTNLAARPGRRAC